MSDDLIKAFICNSCGAQYNTKPLHCPNCKTYNSVVDNPDYIRPQQQTNSAIPSINNKITNASTPKSDKTVRVVTTKEALKKAYEEKADKIIIKGKLASDVNKCLVFSKVSAGAIVGITAAIATATAAVAAAPVTGGISSIAAIPAVAAICTVTGTDVAIVIIALAIGFAIVWGITHDYNVKAKAGKDGVELECDKKS